MRIKRYGVSLGMALAALVLMLFTPSLLPGDIQAENGVLLLGERDGYRLYAGETPPPGSARFFDRETLFSGLLLYVGRDAPLPADLPVQQARDVRSMVKLYIPAAARVALSEKTIYALCDLVRENPLVHTWIMAGMRSPAEQQAMRKAAFAGYQATMTIEQALEKARADIPDSGQSEHQLNTCFDIRLDGLHDWSLDDPMARTADGRWLLENAWRYGFIRRYPPEKAEITGVRNEAAHWRYVGAHHAAAMGTADWCLEEYLRALAEYGALRLETPAGKSVWLLCAPLTEGAASFIIPEGWIYEVSADNLGRAVCAMFRP